MYEEASVGLWGTWLCVPLGRHFSLELSERTQPDLPSNARRSSFAVDLLLSGLYRD